MLHQDFIISNFCTDERNGLDLVAFLECAQVEGFPQFLSCICPMRDIVFADEIPQLTALAFVSIARLWVNPPVNKFSHPTFPIRIAGGSNVWCNATGRTITREHIEKLALREVNQLIKHQQRYLSALVVILLLLIEHIGESNLCARWEPPLDAWCQYTCCAKIWVDFLAGGIKTASVHYLRSGLPEYDGLKTGVVDMP